VGHDSIFARSTPAAADQVNGGNGIDRAQVDALDGKVLVETLLA
jgi:hypothetical protein